MYSEPVRAAVKRLEWGNQPQIIEYIKRVFVALWELWELRFIGLSGATTDNINEPGTYEPSGTRLLFSSDREHLNQTFRRQFHFLE